MLELVAQSIASGIAIGFVYGLIGIGFCVIYNASGIVNFAQGAFVMLGGMIERIVIRPLWNRQSTAFVMILATLAAQIVIERLTLLMIGDQPRTLPMFTDVPPLRIAGIALSYQFFWIIGCSALVIVLL